ncbi:MAG TPA: dihydropteroate synthase [Bacteroidales bacterium]|nr:dihydropteroate synthase [Bacteroidales bacterium]
MQTVLKGRTSEVVIDTGGPVVIIGESINPTRRKKLVSTLEKGDFNYLMELAQNQVDEMADVLDVNVGFPGVDDVKLLPRVVKALNDSLDIPLCIDSPDPAAIEAALKVAVGKCLINSVNGGKKSMDALFPVARDYGAAIIALAMDEDGIPSEPVKRLEIAERIASRAVAAGIGEEDIIIDPLAMAVSADPQACMTTLETTRLIRTKLGLNMTIGASNISFGLPDRQALNAAFIILAIYNGVTCPIANPSAVTSVVRATDLILERDEYAFRFVEHYQLTKDINRV